MMLFDFDSSRNILEAFPSPTYLPRGDSKYPQLPKVMKDNTQINLPLIFILIMNPFIKNWNATTSCMNMCEGGD